ncbi:MAG: AbrB/MazE/SpoVT family DNA-binding domain-containing protein [Deltaproteobacteria bacterium]|nr:AbrB/MazE/SpoVT family DNA-binding domain-containing protein [Deltaproteobacteria bacterium]
MLSTVTTKGQVTIPKKIREALKIGPSDKIDFVQEGERVLIVPLKRLQDFRGAIRAQKTLSFEEERVRAKRSVARRAIEEMR